MGSGNTHKLVVPSYPHALCPTATPLVSGVGGLGVIILGVDWKWEITIGPMSIAYITCARPINIIQCAYQ